MLTVTLKDLRRWDPCRDRYHHLLAGLDPRPGDDEPIPLTKILDVSGLNDTLWVLQHAKEKRLLARLATDCVGRAVERFWTHSDVHCPQEAVAAALKWADRPMDEDGEMACDAAEECSTEPGDESPPVAAIHAAAISTFADSIFLGPAVVVNWARRAGCATDWIVERLRKIIEGEK